MIVIVWAIESVQVTVIVIVRRVLAPFVVTVQVLVYRIPLGAVIVSEFVPSGMSV